MCNNRLKTGTVLMRSGLGISIIGHVVVLAAGLMFAGARPLDLVPAAAIAVDIVSQSDMDIAAAATSPTTPAPTPPAPDNPYFTGSSPASLWPVQGGASPPPAQSSRPSAPSPPHAQSSPPPVPKGSAANRNAPQAGATPPVPSPAAAAPTAPQKFALFDPPLASSAPPAQPKSANFPDMFALPLALPDGSLGGGFDAPAIDSAEIGQDETAAFRDRIKTCASLPETVSPDDKIKIVLRISFMPDGTLADEPMLIEGSPSAKGLALKQSAVQALRRCQPYAMLPADKYKEWKSLDLSFTPRDMAHG
jgi:hypothetical protein